MYSDPSDCLPRLASSEKKLLAHPDAAYYEPLKLPGRAVRFPAPADTSVQKVPHLPNASIHNASSLVPSTIHPKPDDATYHPTQNTRKDGVHTLWFPTSATDPSTSNACFPLLPGHPGPTPTRAFVPTVLADHSLRKKYLLNHTEDTVLYPSEQPTTRYPAFQQKPTGQPKPVRLYQTRPVETHLPVNSSYPVEKRRADSSWPSAYRNHIIYPGS